MPITILVGVKEEWVDAWQSVGFRRKVLTGFGLVVTILSLFPLFFQTIEKRQGVLLHDPLLAFLPPHNVSMPLFIIIWAISLLAVFRAAQHPYMFLTFIWSYVLLCVLRTLSITLVPLDPPVGLVGLVDPISNFFYGEKFVTKDLFFSGHTSTIFLLFLILPTKTDKGLALLATALVACLLLVQHVHYTLDILGGLFFAWFSFRVMRGTLLRNDPPY